MAETKPPDLDQIDLVARDMEATLAFYRALGVDIPETAIWRTATGIHHVDVTLPGGLIVHFDSEALARAYDRGWRAPVIAAGTPAAGAGTRVVLSFKVPAPEDVDRLHDTLVRLGHPSAQPPYDAFWGSRYAIVADPDGTHIGIMGPRDDARRRAPPDL